MVKLIKAGDGGMGRRMWRRGYRTRDTDHWRRDEERKHHIRRGKNGPPKCAGCK